MLGWVGIFIALGLAMWASSLHWPMRRSIIVLAIAAAVSTLAAPHAHAQQHEDRDWVEVESSVGGVVDTTGRLQSAGNGEYAAIVNGNEWYIRVTSSGGIFTYDFESSTGAWAIGDSPDDHATIPLDISDSSPTRDWEIVAWAPEEDEEEEEQPFQWVEVRIPNNNEPSQDNPHFYEGSVSTPSPIPPGVYRLVYEPDAPDYTYQMRDRPSGHMVLEARVSGGKADFFIRVGTGDGDTWSIYDQDQDATPDIVPYSGNGTQDHAQIIQWGDPWVDENGDGEPDNPDEPPADDPDSDGDGDPDSTDPDDDNDGTDDEDELPEVPDTGIDCIDEWLNEAVDNPTAELLDSISNGGTQAETFTINIQMPSLFGASSLNGSYTISTMPDTSTPAGQAIDSGRVLLLTIFKAAIVIYSLNKIILALRQL